MILQDHTCMYPHFSSGPLVTQFFVLFCVLFTRVSDMCVRLSLQLAGQSVCQGSALRSSTE